MDSAIQYYCERGLAPSTLKTYKAAAKKFRNFCQLYSVSKPFPVSEYLLCSFVAYMASSGLSSSSIKTYLSAIRHLQILEGLPAPQEASSLPRLKLLQMGVQRDRAKRAVPFNPCRLPITPSILRRIHSMWFSSPSSDASQDNLILWSASVLCFLFFFRAGELFPPSMAAFDTSVHQSWGDIAVNDTRNPTFLRVHLKRSKCDQLARGVDVFVGRTGDSLCPVAAILSYVATRGPTPGCFFQFRDRTPLTKPRFITLVRQALHQAGIPETGYSGHSFRIGAPTTAAHAGIEDSTIQALGRWNSLAFLRYIRMSRETLAHFSCPLARMEP